MEFGRDRLSSLRGLAASSISFQQLLSTCDNPSFIDSEICSWETWRERAYLKFGVPYEYFDLARVALVGPPKLSSEISTRNIPGSFRYLEIATKFKLIPESTTSLNKRTGTVSGIYESYTGVLEAVRRNNIEGIDIFFPRLRKEQKEKLRKHIQYHQYWIMSPPEFGFAAFEYLTYLLFEREEVQKILTENYSDDKHFWGDYGDTHQPPEWQIVVEKLEKNKADDGTRLEIGEETSDERWEGLMYLISQGCRFALTQALSTPIKQPRGKWSHGDLSDAAIKVSINIHTENIFEAVLQSGQIDMLNRVLHFRPFLEIPSEGNSVDEVLALGRNPNSQHERARIDNDYFRAACYSGNPLFVDFLLALNDDPFYRPECGPINRGWYTRRNPVGYYQILQKCNLEDATEEILELGDIDMILYVYSMITNEKDLVSKIIRNNPGNVDILLTFLPFYQGDDTTLLEAIKPKIYPLSSLIIRGAYVDF